jgi:hypothetical protein
VITSLMRGFLMIGRWCVIAALEKADYGNIIPSKPTFLCCPSHRKISNAPS